MEHDARVASGLKNYQHRGLRGGLMAKIYKWGEVRKEQGCHDRGHDFKFWEGTRNETRYRCKCGATAVANEEKLTIRRRQW